MATTCFWDVQVTPPGAPSPRSSHCAPHPHSLSLRVCLQGSSGLRAASELPSPSCAGGAVGFRQGLERDAGGLLPCTVVRVQPAGVSTHPVLFSEVPWQPLSLGGGGLSRAQVRGCTSLECESDSGACALSCHQPSVGCDEPQAAEQEVAPSLRA